MEKMIKKFNSVQFLLLLFMVFPILTYAVTTPTNFRGLVMIVVDLITAILPIIVLLAFIYFLWGLVKYLKDAGGNKDEATQMMLNGVIGFFVMASVWGLVNLLSASLGTGIKKPDLEGAEEYLTGIGVEESLREHERSLLEAQDYNLNNSYEDFSVPGGSNTGSDRSVVVEQEGEGGSGGTQDWFTRLLPWNWF